MAVSDGRNLLVPPELSGDEPCLIAESVPGAVVMAGKNRLGAASYALEKFSPDLFILDDGFQHWKIQRDLDIVCVNALNPFGNGCLIPAGILREPLSALERADLVVITSSDLVSDEHLSLIEKEVSGYTQAKIIKAKYAPKGFKRITDSQLFAIDDLRKDKFCALSAIGENSGFKKLLEKHGINTSSWLDFRDHHWYNLDEIKRIDPVLKVVTTTKDAVRLKNILSQLPHDEAARFYALDIELEFINGAEIWENRIWKNRIKLKPRSSSTAMER
jgi:tetraacyldisaccharide 4'-kinase